MNRQFSGMKINTTKAIHSVHPGKIILPLLIGLGVAIFIFFREGTLSSILTIQFSTTVIFFLFMAARMIVARITGYVIRLRILSEKKNWHCQLYQDYPFVGIFYGHCPFCYR